jgi:lipopolysaccharide transport system permease protein
MNPVAPVIEGFRFAFLGFGIVGRGDYILSVITSTVIFVIGVAMFSHAEQTAMDNI